MVSHADTGAACLCVVYLYWVLCLCLCVLSCMCGYLDCAFVVSHADTGAAVPADVHGGVGAVLDVLVLRHAIHLPIHTHIVRRTCDRQKHKRQNL